MLPDVHHGRRSASARLHDGGTPSVSPHPWLTVASLWLFFAVLSADAEGYFTVTDITGSARIQRAQKKSVEDVAVKTRIQDNDLVETFFQARTVLVFGSGSTAILGPNSKALFNITERGGRGENVSQASVTLFAGGIFVKTAPPMRVKVFTANGVAEMDSGSLSAVVDAKTNESGFQVLGGSVRARNIAQQTARTLISGQTTMILPGREPTAPLYLTNRHVNVLKLFFGDAHIAAELRASNISPTEEASGGQRLRLSDNLMLSKSQRDKVESGTYKRLFSLDKIYQTILEDRSRNAWLYSPVAPSAPLFKNRMQLWIGSSLGLAGGDLYPAIWAVPSLSLRTFSLGLRVTGAANYQREFGAHTLSGSGLRGILDFVDYIQIGHVADSLYLRLGRLSDYTIGNGMVVDRLENRDPNSLLWPLALHGKAGFSNGISVDGFVGDVTNLSYGGLFVSFRPSSFCLGAGYYYDLNQTIPPYAGPANRFVRAADTAAVDTAPVVHIIQADLSADVISRQEVVVSITCDGALRLFNPGRGVVIRVPGVDLSLPRVHLGAGLVVEAGQLISGQFNWMYPTNRCRVVRSDTTAAARILTQNDVLHRGRSTRGFELSLGANPLKGTSISLLARHEFFSRYVPLDDSNSSKLDFGYDVRFAFNDTLIPFVRHGEFFLSQPHGAIYPFDGAYLSSWGVRAGARVQTLPLILNIALEAGFDYYLLDLDADNRLDDSDRVFEISAGLRWGFL